MAKGVKTGGRKAGTPNKLTGAVKDMVLKALSNVGGVNYLEAQAQNNPTAFLTLVGKIIPHEVSGLGGGAIIVKLEAADANA